ncbi:MAG: M14 family metallopeptidase [Bacteroidales bacterium]
MKRAIIPFFLLLCIARLSAQIELKYSSNRTPDYQELIGFYKTLDRLYDQALLTEAGKTDAGERLHLLIIDKDRQFKPELIRKQGKLVLFINNGIHPGESCGIDASLQLAMDLLKPGSKLAGMLDRVVVCIVPVYNIDGMLNRSKYNRANQNGPEEQGFRANGRNLDLNRDFVKSDSRNSRSLIGLFQEWNPDILVDTHVSDGADYQYAMTLISPFPQNTGPSLTTYLHDKMVPALFDRMKEAGSEMIPYVETRGETPESGIELFPDQPRFFSGYATLFNTLAFVSEAHMLKPYSVQVEATLRLLETMLAFGSENAPEILRIRQAAIGETMAMKKAVLKWERDTSRYREIQFKGYEAKTKISEVTGLPRLYYDQSAPWEKTIKYFDHFVPSLEVEIPEFYIVPYAWEEVIERLRNSGIEMKKLDRDTTMEVEVMYIDEYKTMGNPYNGRYLHSQVQTRAEKQRITFRKGDKVIDVRQPGLNYIVQTLDPRGPDAFFAWNFFDGILSRKEYFSDYLFEDTAAALLKSDPELKRLFEEKRSADAKFAGNARAQLTFIYEHSPWAERTYRRYPVIAIRERISLPVK